MAPQCGVLSSFVVRRRGDPSGYRVRAASEMRRIRSRAGLNKSAFARALSLELGRNYLPHHVTRWEAGDQLPKTDIFLAALTLAGVDDPLCGEAGATTSGLQRRMNLIQEQLTGMMTLTSRQLDLPPASEPRENYVSTPEAARLLGVSRQTVYTAIEDGRLAAYRWEGRTLLRRQDVEAAKEEGRIGKAQTD